MKISLRRRHAPMIKNGAFSHKRDYITIFWEILNLEGHQNRISGSRVRAILLNGLIFPIWQSGEASRWRVCYQRGLPHLVYLYHHSYWTPWRMWPERGFHINPLFVDDRKGIIKLFESRSHPCYLNNWTSAIKVSRCQTTWLKCVQTCPTYLSQALQ